MGDDHRWTERQARDVLGLEHDAPLAAWRPAFNLAIKSAHPDQGGTSEDARRVIDAYRFLKALETQRHSGCWIRSGRPQTSPRTFEISVEEAILGVMRDVYLERGQPFRVRLPPGMRFGDTVDFGPHGGQWLIRIHQRADAEIRGSDLCSTVLTTASFARRGGALTVHHPRGERKVWVTPTMARDRRVVIPGAGLPARGAHAAGDALIRLAVA